ncbi:hypothetical protein EJB05_47671 [Eragrostis curvula]|uniref:Ubiquitin-like domain-containing protein n=1 Tax=Eragrostis curvula TaxID=38414 RepID=A0A5J9SZQ4_9POAL|nr:hypothetical protein EJB05_47671 [Eragrostis curvula]
MPYHGGASDSETALALPGAAVAPAMAATQEGGCLEGSAGIEAVGKNINPIPVVEIRSAAPTNIENALLEVDRKATQTLAKQGTKNQLQLLIVILPDASDSEGFLRRETNFGIVTQCCLAKDASERSKKYMADVAQKISVKVGGRNSVLEQATSFITTFCKKVTNIIRCRGTCKSPQEREHAICEAPHTPPVEELSSITTVFVCVYEYKISMPINLHTTTVGELIQAALMKKNIKIEDALFQSNGRILDEHNLLHSVHIQQDSSIFVTRRSRGGVPTSHILWFENLSVVLLNNSQRLFKTVKIPINLVLPAKSPFVSLLSPFFQFIINKILVCVLRDGHQEKICWGGAFELQHFLVSNGHIIIDPTLKTYLYTPQKGADDYLALYSILSGFLEPQTKRYPLHLDHLLKELQHHDSILMANPNYITFLINHSCLQSYAEKQMTYTLVDRMICTLPSRKHLRCLLNKSPCMGWDATVKLVPAFKTVYSFQSYTKDVDQEFPTLMLTKAQDDSKQ